MADIPIIGETEYNPDLQAFLDSEKEDLAALEQPNNFGTTYEDFAPEQNFAAQDEFEQSGNFGANSQDFASPSTDFAARQEESFQAETSNIQSHQSIEQQSADQLARDKYSASVDYQTGETEPLRAWRAKRDVTLAEKDAKEKAAVQEMKAKAKQEHDDWYARYEEQKQKAKKANREGEAAFIAERDGLSNLSPFEAVSKLVDFNAKNSKNVRDTSRMRSVLLSVKQTPQA